jgi:hypothetical protein
MKKTAALAALLVLAMLPASARPWQPKGVTLAQDYAVIVDSRSSRDLVEIFWMAWPIIETASPVIREALDRYIIVGLSHGRSDAGGQMVFDKEEGAEASSLDGTALKAITPDRYPPAVAAAVAAMGSFMRQSMGAMGEGMKYMAFESNDVRACEKGRLSLRYAGETYAYDTPFPGCPAP